METYTGDFTTGQGGVFTEEVGVITGDVTLRTEVDKSGSLVVRVQYKDADEWYTVTGGHAQLTDASDGRAVHGLVLGVLARGDEGKD